MEKVLAGAARTGERIASTGNQTEECCLSNAEFSRLKDLIYDHCGIKITEAKRTMLESRLRKRLRSLGLASFTQYCDFLFSHEGMQKEMTPMIDQVTTNKTDFFREPGHFEYLEQKVLPDLVRTKRDIMVWSAGCSTGEEPYTLAMVLADFAENRRGMNFTILATDISTRVLEKAKLAVYDEETIAPVPFDMKKKYLLRSRDGDQRRYRVAPELREIVRFRRLNFMDGDFGFREEVDVIFCRNVIIYFDKPTQERLLNKFCKCLSPRGYLFMGHSETLLGMDLPLAQMAPTVYQRIT
jgi:chemotaxis protein methyltransferase CheR